ncbi:hypothetical protein H072_4771 [Dactylellina haptotyla CBS 200.50]|uniref:Galactose-1-phosphate uridylyltransferase n=1 Tax=Dactylellina haptotyla (strain CBS 200.50) TaxID=1284197 RepID=S8AJQ0_DACHA|nr:hypothetical protein H072_4771 [Dactylellina haptotyla CBS 200.50]
MVTGISGMLGSNKRSGGAQNPDYDSTFIFVNDFSAVKETQEGYESEKGDDKTSRLIKAEGVKGKCFVICFSPAHNKTLADMSIKEISLVVDTWKNLYRDVQEKTPFRYIQIFENKGESMGCSNPHAHCQAWTTSHLPEEPAAELKNLIEYKRTHNSCMLCDYLAVESEKKERIVAENDGWLAVCPWWAFWPFETLVISKKCIKNILEIQSERDVELFSEIISTITVKYDNLFETKFPYSMGIHQAPLKGSEEEHSASHVHFHFLPPLLRSATVKKFQVGYELLAEPQRDITPEQAARRLQDLSIVASIAIAFKLYVSYQRYQDARGQWSRLRITTRNLARLIWLNIPDGPRIRPKTTPPTQTQVEQKLREDLLSKASVIRLLVGFVFALKHHVRREYGTEWPDVRSRVGYLPTFARRAHPTQVSVSQSLYISMDDPEKGLPAIPTARRISTAPALWLQSLFSKEEVAKRQQNMQNHKSMIAYQNLPLEILSFLGSYADSLNYEKKLVNGLAICFHQELATLNEILGKCEGLMEAHMPLPYTVIIAQIKWLFLILLPFQLLQAMSWITVPAVVMTAFSLLGLSAAASTLSNPFGATQSPTSLPLDEICTAISIEVDTICSATHQPSFSNFVFTGMHMMVAGEKDGVGWMYLKGNKPLAPLVKKDFGDCVKSLSIGDILEVMKMKVEMPEG